MLGEKTWKRRVTLGRGEGEALLKGSKYLTYTPVSSNPAQAEGIKQPTSYASQGKKPIGQAA